MRLMSKISILEMSIRYIEIIILTYEYWQRGLKSGA